MSVSVGAVAGEVEGFVFGDGDEVGESVNHSVLNQARANWSLCRWMAMGAQGGRLYVADVFDEEEDEDVVFVLGSVHAAAEFVAGGPEGTVEFRFSEGHGWGGCGALVLFGALFSHDRYGCRLGLRL